MAASEINSLNSKYDENQILEYFAMGESFSNHPIAKSILNKYHGLGKDESGAVITAAHSKSEKDLMMELAKFNAVMENAFEETAPHKICAYIYDLANAFNSFYHGTKIMAEEDEVTQKSYIRLLGLTKSVLETCIDVLGFSAPDRM